ncbi:bifunctional indole-3-glycerol-phosphate synthase TrpC/phosphoribosylanthranilate isomerase TrpF [Corynebacterium uropygiale]|uniref:N-(5'-phosphoribosyl)anthranilate isomerase n=1 Tax=Corynebacterium uropygiale TaxID=1775911 RepID=A0A9X1QVA1_9CORY|nr:bifunctional indole-3-glycerol-phosphate synthase TrpC/phosphoribosylanthranilate isomerase TrpF [Corynebacterium uropygiale]MCF4007650.1 bifunctional indole-3-glycerol-phosphate synthase TrpC/phosphoribosylanthranilate isomerase TrpF [Corynebacterium uropygiale]
MQNDIPTVLEGIVSARRTHLPEIRERIAHVDPARLPRSTRSLYTSLGGGVAGAQRAANRFIMECKSSSPSLGLIREDYHPAEIASIYSRYASGISVLCEPERFGGDYNHLAAVASTTHLPVLCKDFIIDPVQIHAARYFGADAILLMLSVLDDDEYRALSAEAERLGLDVLTEVIDEEEVSRGTSLGARIFGVNHRNLHDLSIDLGRSARLAPLIPEDAVLVSESGIRDHATVQALGGHSHAFLVGSQLTSQPDIDLAARELVYGPNKVCGLRSGSAAQAAKAAGAVYGGLIFEAASPRNVSRETAAEIMRAEPGLRYVAVSRRTENWSELLLPGISAVQLHAPLQGSLEEEEAFIRRVRAEVGPDIEIWRAISMSSEQGPATAEALARHPEISRLVLDSGEGGTGQAFPWSRIPESVTSTALLAGGIGPDNIREALDAGLLGVDLNSGVEYPAGAGRWARHKDAALLTSIFRTIRDFSRDTHEDTP